MVVVSKLLYRQYSTSSMPFDEFMELAHCPEDYIREAIAENYYTPSEILEILARDKHARVRESVAAHPKTPLDLLPVLLKDEDGDVRMACLENYDITLSMIVKMLTVETDAGVRWEAVERMRDFPKESLRSALVDAGLSDMVDLPYEWVMKVMENA